MFGVCVWPWLHAAAYAKPTGAALVAGSDERLIAWVLGWVSHALATSPAHVFDANVNYPAPSQLAGTEHFLSTQIVFAPVFFVTGNALLGANVAALVSYPLAAFVMERFLLALGIGGLSAWTGGLMFALGPLRVPGNLQIVQYQNLYLPLVALAITHLRRDPTPRRMVLLAVAYTLALLSSYYAAVLVSLAALIWGLYELRAPQESRARFAGRALGAVVVSAALLYAVSQPYLQRSEGPQSGLELTIRWASFAWQEFWHAPGLMTFLNSAFSDRPGFRVEMLLEPKFLGEVLRQPATWSRLGLQLLRLFALDWFGTVPLVLAGIGAVVGLQRSFPAAPVARRGLVIGAIGGLLSLGPALVLFGKTLFLPYSLFVWSPLHFFRLWFRFLVLAGFGTALLAACALEFIQYRGGRVVGTLAAAGTVVWLIGVQATRLDGLGLEEVAAQTLPIYDLVRQEASAHGDGPLLELPFVDPMGHGLQRESMLGSTRHWLPLVHGLTGYPAIHHALFYGLVDRLPDPRALEDLVDLTHVRWLLLRPVSDWPQPSLRSDLLTLAQIERVADRDGWTLARITAVPRRPEPFAAVAVGPLPPAP